MGDGGHGTGRVELSQDCGDVQQFDFIMSDIMMIKRRWWGDGGHGRSVRRSRRRRRQAI